MCMFVFFGGGGGGGGRREMRATISSSYSVFLPFQSSTQVQGKKRTWKGLKQIIAAERSLPWKPDDPTCEFEHDISTLCVQLCLSLSDHAHKFSEHAMHTPSPLTLEEYIVKSNFPQQCRCWYAVKFLAGDCCVKTLPNHIIFFSQRLVNGACHGTPDRPNFHDNKCGLSPSIVHQ